MTQDTVEKVIALNKEITEIKKALEYLDNGDKPVHINISEQVYYTSYTIYTISRSSFVFKDIVNLLKLKLKELKKELEELN